MKFCVLTIAGEAREALFSFFLTEPGQITEQERRFDLSPDQIAAMNPNTKTASIFRSRADAELTAKIYARTPVLINDTEGREGNPWRMSFTRMFDMATDSDFFRTAVQLRTSGYVKKGPTGFTKLPV